jgi:hypothetical protein
MAGLQEMVSSTVIAVLGTAIRDASDAEIERRFGSRAAQLTLLGGMAWSFDPAGADGFEGELAYVVSRPNTGGRERWLTIEVTGQRARVRPGAGPNAQVTLRLQLADLVKIAAGELEAATPLMQGRASVEGDMMLAVRIPQMFGPPRRDEAPA